jgi:hypothetical protein
MLDPISFPRSRVVYDSGAILQVTRNDAGALGEVHLIGHDASPRELRRTDLAVVRLLLRADAQLAFPVRPTDVATKRLRLLLVEEA